MADHAARAAADQLSGREDLVHGLEHRLGRRQVPPETNTTASSQRCAAELGAPPARGRLEAPPRAGPGAVDEAGADADAPCTPR